MKKTLLFMLMITMSISVIFAEGQQEENKWPSKSVSVIVPYSAGGGTDRMARMITPFLEDEFGESVVVVNRPGAGGEIGMAAMNKAKPDGYTLGLIAFPDNISMASYKEVSYNNDKFIYLASFTETPTVLVVPPDSPYDNLKEFVSYAKENPGKLTVSESGDSHTLTTVLFEEAADIDLTTVSYSGGGDNFNAVLGGHVDAGVMALLFAESAMDQGCKVIGVAGNNRVEQFPDLPTFKENGFAVNMISSRILTVPTGTPDTVVSQLKSYIAEVGKSDDLAKKIKTSGEVYAFRSGSALDDFIDDVGGNVARIATSYKEKFLR